MLTEYAQENPDFAAFVEEDGFSLKAILENIHEENWLSSLYASGFFFKRYGRLFRYFDDWVVIKTNEDDTKITDIVVKKRKEKRSKTYRDVLLVISSLNSGGPYGMMKKIIPER